MLTKMLKQVVPEIETQEETTSEDQLNQNAFEEFRRNKKINVQSDIQAVG